MKVPLSVLYEDGSIDHSVTIDLPVFRESCRSGTDMITSLEAGAKRIVALVPFPVSNPAPPRKESLQ